MLAAMFGVICVALYSEIRRSPKTLMAKFKLHPEKTEEDFRLMMYSNAGLTLFMSVLALGNALNAENLVSMGYIGLVLSALLVVDVVGSWVFRYT
ncbi:hypothetical protein AQV86_03500 [Nanohaloarchaea archaeon SG9]|nr:hypothetical protein AQV86_03500 [Nanohaloarchaea archaeon SG9]